MRKILAITGARSEYDLLSPVFERLNSDARFKLGMLVTGSHLSEKFGNTIDYILKDGFHVEDRVYNLIDSSTRIGRIISLGNQIQPFAQVFERFRPDIVLVAGDREEAISATMTAAFMDVPVAHFFGGDVAKDGNIDNSIRYAASKFAHIHFPTLEEHRQVLLRLGEDDWRIHVVGNPALDKFVNTPAMTMQQLSKELKCELKADEKYLILIQHPIVTEVEQQAAIIEETLEAIVSMGLKCFVSYPNSDPGNFDIIKAYEEYSKKHSQIYLYHNLDRNVYVNLMRHASCQVGNSSSGILEAPSVHLPVVNIGSRQRGRTNAGNVIYVDYDKGQIKEAILKSIYDESYRKRVKTLENPYGNGKSSYNVVEILAAIDLNSDLIYKNITY